MKGKVTILCGLPGSGKSWYTKQFVDNDDVIILNLDKELFKKFGKTFEDGKYQEYEKTTKESLLEEALQNLRKGKHVIFDYGFWKERERDEYRKFAADNDFTFELIYFSTPINTLKTRLKKRNAEEPEDNHVIPPEMLDDFIAEFEPPRECENAARF